jgi:membrane associated rhomboid family serine protease
MQTCYRHPSVETGVSCSSCGNPICPDCMTPTPVGMRCPECAKQKTNVQTPRAMSASEPRVTQVLIAINVVVFFAQVAAGGGGLRADEGRVYLDGVLFGPWVADGDWWRLVSSGFLHADPIHLLLNMVALFFLGQWLEPALGAVRFLALYAASLFAGALGVILLGNSDPTVGASGAVYGLMGAAFVLLYRRGINPFQTWLGGILIINLLFTFSIPNISKGGHIGGLIGGCIAALLIAASEERRMRVVGLVACLALAGLCGGLAIAAAEPEAF